MSDLNLNQTLSWTKALAAVDPSAAAELAMLHDLQGNILKGHGRHWTSNLFIVFDPLQEGAAKSFLAEVGGVLINALDQLTGARSYKSGGPSAGDFYAMFMSAAGYDALGLATSKPDGEAFNEGMKQRSGLNDPPSEEWDIHFSSNIHAMILIAAQTEIDLVSARSNMVAKISATGGAVTLLNPQFQEDGKAIFNSDYNGIEHFGYVDGRSQPLVLQEDVEEEETMHGGISNWDPSIQLSQLLVKCPGGELEVSHGSFFVFRKLDQNVFGFKSRERKLAIDIEDREHMQRDEIGERFGATVVGRFENGTPATLFGAEQQPIPQGPIGVMNNFNYGADADGLKCPFAGHIRKTNPRGDAPGSKGRLMARRGIPYGVRTDEINGDDINDKPLGDVGLLFMAYQSSLEDQFEFTQSSWANNVDFARPLVLAGTQTGIDPVIGQFAGPTAQRWPVKYGLTETDGRDDDDFSGFVKMRGGEYFFAPSISFFTSLN